MADWRVIEGGALRELRRLNSGIAQTCVTSPPYFGLRDYGTATWEGGDEGCDHKGDALASDKSTLAGYTSDDVKVRTNTMPFRGTCGKCGATRVDSQIGLEPTPDEYVASLVEVFREVRRVLRDDGTLWLNLGDSYAANRTYQAPSTKGGAKHSPAQGFDGSAMSVPDGMKPKDLIGIPWMVAFALRADGWYLRSDIIWAKPNPMPESVTDRPTKAHEYLFLLSKSPRYFYDADAIREEMAPESEARYAYDFGGPKAEALADADKDGIGVRTRTIGQREPTAGRNKRSVWTVATQPFPGAHFAVFPPKLIEPCVLAGSKVGDTVLDPFCGAGTTGVVATRHGRGFVGVELNPEYAEMARERIRDDAPLMNYITEAA